MEAPNNEDLFIQNACYAKWSNKCIELNSFDERKACMSHCPWECNHHCFDQCHKAGLNTTWGDVCGCHSQHSVENTDQNQVSEIGEKESKNNQKEQKIYPQEEYSIESEGEQEIKQVQNELEEPAKYTQTISNYESDGKNSQIPNSSDSHQSNETIDEQESEQRDEVGDTDVAKGVINSIDASNTTKSNEVETPVEFKDLMNKMLDEPDYCKSDCWRKCLQMRADKETVFKCIKDWGWGGENPQLLFSKEPESTVTEESSAGSMAFIPLIFLFLVIGGVAYFIYKREFENKEINDTIIEEDDEEGYKKLD